MHGFGIPMWHSEQMVAVLVDRVILLGRTVCWSPGTAPLLCHFGQVISPLWAPKLMDKRDFVSE